MAFLLDFVEPLLVFAAHEGIFFEAGIDEGVSVGVSDVFDGRVELLLCLNSMFFEVFFVDLFGRLGVDNFEVFGEMEVIFGKQLVGGNLEEFLVVFDFVIWDVAVACELEHDLFEDESVLAFLGDLLDEAWAVQSQSDSDSLGIFLALQTDVEGCHEHLFELLLVRGVGCVRKQVGEQPLDVTGVGELD